MKIMICSVCGNIVPSTMVGVDGRCPECLKKDGIS